MRILVVEDEPRVASFVAAGLEGAGYAVEVAGTAARALELVEADQEFHLVLLDVGLPDMDGFALLQRLRQRDQHTPVIMLTARSDVPSKVKGLDLGADDYLPKPFDFEELLARVRAHMRHTRQPAAFSLQVGDLSLDLKTRRVSSAGTQVSLTSREFTLLEFLMRHAGQVLTRSQILNGVWGYTFDPGSNVVDVYIGYLRSKLDAPGAGSLIETVRGGGYRLEGHLGSE
jgi:two-component system, OmpR family, copper resistance phosphate regulon response regulator CusR